MAYDIGKITSEYSDKLKKHFEENDGKLFIVDYSKSCALQALKELLADKDGYRSLLCVVDDKEVATEFATVLKGTVGEITVVDTFSRLEELYKEISNGLPMSALGNLKSLGRRFKEAYPNFIITARDEETGEALFNRYLCMDGTKNGVFDGKENVGYFCVSDLLSAFRYEFVVVDNVYARLSLEEQNYEQDKVYAPGRYERIDFLGKTYYADYTHSFKRLNNVMDGAKKCVAISDVIVEANAVNLYLALELLYGKSSLLETRELVLRVSENYEDDCEEICGQISNYNNDEVLARCMQKLIGCKQTVPKDMYAMADYFSTQFEYMSEEEIFLRIVDAFTRTKFKGKLVSIQPIVDMLDNTMEMVNCLCELFFSNEIKGALEGALTTSEVRKMTEEQIASLFEIFLRYGVYHSYPQDDDRCKVVRLKRDDSAYERYVRQISSERKDDEYSYSVLHDGSTLLYKCVAIKDMLGDEAKSGFTTPMLVVTRANSEKVLDTLSKLLPDYECTLDINRATDPSKKTITIIDYELFRETALWLDIRSAVFFDIEYDAVILKNLINKALRYGDVTAYLLADYGDLSGVIADAWQDELLSPNQKAMPIDNSKISVKGGEERTYAEVIRELEEVYCLLSDIVSKGKKKYLAPCAEKFNKLITDFTSKSTIQTKELLDDFGYLAALAKDYNAIFKNCVSVGGEGEQVLNEKYYFKKIMKTIPSKKPSKPPKQEEVIIEELETEERRVCFFNVCLKMLRRNCDCKKNNCNGCKSKSYDRFKINNFEAFQKGVEGLFEKTLEFAKWQEQARLRELENATISHTETENDKKGRLIVDEVTEYAEIAKSALEKIVKHARKKQLICVDYEQVESICSAAEKAYSKLLGKYYEVVMEIFETATEESKRGFGLVNNSFLSAHSGE